MAADFSFLQLGLETVQKIKLNQILCSSWLYAEQKNPFCFALEVGILFHLWQLSTFFSYSTVSLLTILHVEILVFGVYKKKCIAFARSTYDELNCVNHVFRPSEK